MASNKRKPEFVRWIPLVLDALRAFGGSAESRDVIDWIANAVKLSAEERERRNKNGIVRFENQVHWARQYLVWEGLLASSKRGVWTLTPAEMSAKGVVFETRALRGRETAEKMERFASPSSRFLVFVPLVCLHRRRVLYALCLSRMPASRLRLYATALSVSSSWFFAIPR